MTKRKKNPKIVLILNGIAFFASGIDCLENYLFLGISNIFVGILNIIALNFIKKHPFSIKIGLNITNAIFAALSSYVYHQANSDLKYGWAIVFIAYTIASVVAYKKRPFK